MHIIKKDIFNIIMFLGWDQSKNYTTQIVTENM